MVVEKFSDIIGILDESMGIDSIAKLLRDPTKSILDLSKALPIQSHSLTGCTSLTMEYILFSSSQFVEISPVSL